jgi:hypothetical protein
VQGDVSAQNPVKRTPRGAWGKFNAAEQVLKLKAFLSADLDLTPEPRPDHAAYIAHWLTV